MLIFYHPVFLPKTRSQFLFMCLCEGRANGEFSVRL